MRDTVPHGWTGVKAPAAIAVTLRDRLAAGETLVGTFAKLAGADPAGVLAGAGFDFAIVVEIQVEICGWNKLLIIMFERILH